MVRASATCSRRHLGVGQGGDVNLRAVRLQVVDSTQKVMIARITELHGQSVEYRSEIYHSYRLGLVRDRPPFGALGFP